MPRDRSRLEQIKGAADVDVYEHLRGVPGDVRLVQRSGMNHRLNAAIEGAGDNRSVGDRTDNLRLDAGYDIKAYNRVPSRSQARSQEATKPARGASQKNVHLCRHRT